MDKLVNKIFCGNSVRVLKELPSDFVDCVVTSPPYWALRDYGIEPQVWGGVSDCQHNFNLKEIQTGQRHWNSGGKVIPYEKRKIRNGAKRELGFCLECGAWRGSLGLEPSFDLFIKHLCDIFDEIKRVLKKEGTCWVNLGDTYASTPSGLTNEIVEINAKKEGSDGLFKRLHKRHTNNMTSEVTWKPNKYEGVIQKSLCMIPFHFAIEMVNRGWILRNTIIWHKPNCMPSSVKDRFTVDFEYVFFFVKSKKYWFERQFEAILSEPIPRMLIKGKSNGKSIGSAYGRVCGTKSTGRNKRCVWTITTKPFKEAHFATFPPGLVEPMIKAGCPEFICKKCRKPKGRILEPSEEYKKLLNQSWTEDTDKSKKLRAKIGFQANTKKVSCTQDYRFIGYTDCKCDAGWENGIVLDPFSGSGTTLAVAKNLGRSYIGIDLNPEYIKMAQRRITKLDEGKNTSRGRQLEV